MTGRAPSAARLVAFVALAAFATAHWAGMVEPAPAGQLALVVAAAAAGGLGLVAIGQLRLDPLRAAILASACAVATIAVALAAIGIAPRLLWPGGWGELAGNLDSGLAGLAGDVDYPYRDGEQWSRLLILAIAPTVLALAATLAFWPASRRARRSLGLVALALLVGLYAAASAVTSPDGALIRGALLLVLIGAWLWLPALRWRDALVAVGLVAVAGALAVPAAAQLRGDPWFDYKNWTLRTPEGATYSWGHSYGPIDWPRDGTRMLFVRSDEAHYWKTVVLDRFNGVRWTRSEGAAVGARDVSDPDPEIFPAGAHPRWLKEFTVAIGELESEVVIAAGVPTRVSGVEGAVAAPDGTTLRRGEALRNGDTYEVRAYIPDPTADQMRAAPEGYSLDLADYTRIDLPAAPAREGGELLPAETVVTPPSEGSLSPRGVLEGPEAKRIARSPYGEMLELARSLTEGRPTAYDSVRAIQDHLRTEYDYSEFPPERTYPLASFLFEDGRGYCQQFSGTMALMLRMAGIPSRVVSGFAPGTRTDDGEGFQVEDFDAHAWVEVYFPEIGWVAFDPTPAAAPVSTQQVPGLPTSEVDRRQGGDDAAEDDEEEDESALLVAAGGGGDSAKLAPVAAVPAALLLALVVGTALVAARSRRHRRLPPAIAAEAQIDELARALDRLGWSTSGGATLLGVERALRRSRRRTAAGYVGRVRALRYAAVGGEPPTLAERRAVRRELSSGRGPAGRLRALLAIPPGGPRVPETSPPPP